MDAATLRWIIIAVGAAILVSIFLFGNPDRKRKPRASRRKAQPAAVRREPTLDAGPEAVDAPPADALTGQGELPIGPRGENGAGPGPETAPVPDRPKAPRKPAGPPPDRIVTLYLLARDNHVISGAELLDGALKTGLEFGDMEIFHRLAEGTDRAVFSLANAVSPGHFDRASWNTFETRGLAIFMTLPGPVLALDAWDAMLATTRRLAELLHAEILDAERAAFTRQKAAEVREAMRSYDRDRARKSLS